MPSVTTVIPPHLLPYVAYVMFSLGTAAHDGVEVMLTKEGTEYARANGNAGSHELARWLLSHSSWQGARTQKNVADEISTHALYANWPVLGKRANPVNIEYFQNWPGSLVLKVRDGLFSTVKRVLRRS
jgi:hypothetical protein